MMKRKIVSVGLYKKVVENFPLVCVDILLKIDGGFLLLKRKKTPFRGWWLAGGRVLKGESLRKAALRKLKEETSINGRIIRIIGVYETKSSKGHFNIRSGTHTVNICFLAEPASKKQKIRIDNAHSNFKIFRKINKSWHAYIKNVIKDSKLLR